MVQSEQINDLAAALAVAQGHIENAKKDAANPFFKSKYSDMASVRDSIRQPFSENGLSYVQTFGHENGATWLHTTLMHASGQWIRSTLPVIAAKERDPQALGSAITYMRRYALLAIAGLASEEDDDDGNTASDRYHGGREERRPVQQQRQAPPSPARTQAQVAEQPAAAKPTAAPEPEQASSPADPYVARILKNKDKKSEELDRVFEELSTGLIERFGGNEEAAASTYIDVFKKNGVKLPSECKSVGQLRKLITDLLHATPEPATHAA